jgi:MFS family permease
MEWYQRYKLLRVGFLFVREIRILDLTCIRPFIFKDMELPGNTTTLLATGVVGIVEFLFTIPAVLWVDQIGRKKILIAGAAGMAICHFIVAGIIGAYQHEFGEHRAAGWTVIVFVWIFVINFAYSWGK